MTAQKGKDLLIKIAEGAGFATVAGLRTRRLSFNAETVENPAQIRDRSLVRGKQKAAKSHARSE